MAQIDKIGTVVPETNFCLKAFIGLTPQDFYFDYSKCTLMKYNRITNVRDKKVHSPKRQKFERI